MSQSKAKLMFRAIIDRLEEEPYLNEYKFLSSKKQFVAKHNGIEKYIVFDTPSKYGDLNVSIGLCVICPLITDWYEDFEYKFYVTGKKPDPGYRPLCLYRNADVLAGAEKSHFWNFDNDKSAAQHLKEFLDLQKTLRSASMKFDQMVNTWSDFYKSIVIDFIDNFDSFENRYLPTNRYFYGIAFAYIMNDVQRYEELKKLTKERFRKVIMREINTSFLLEEFQYFYDNFDDVIAVLESYDFAKYIKKHKIDLSK